VKEKTCDAAHFEAKECAMRRTSCLFIFAFTMMSISATATRGLPATVDPKPARAITPFDFSRVNKAMMEEFEKAWRISKNGTSDAEGVILFYLLPDGSYKVKGLNSTNEFKSATFVWEDGIIAIFHTHPRAVDPRPSDGDIKVADKYRVLMFTLSLRGMYVYDPQTKKTSAVMYGVDWLDQAKWTDELSMRMAALSPSFSSRLVASSSR
jgi:hypothetical protein